MFAIVFVTINGQTYKLFKNGLNGFLTEDKGEINMVKHKYSEKCISVEWLNNTFFINSTTFFFTIKECNKYSSNNVSFDLSDQHACARFKRTICSKYCRL